MQPTEKAAQLISAVGIKRTQHGSITNKTRNN